MIFYISFTMYDSSTFNPYIIKTIISRIGIFQFLVWSHERSLYGLVYLDIPNRLRLILSAIAARLICFLNLRGLAYLTIITLIHIHTSFINTETTICLNTTNQVRFNQQWTIVSLAIVILVAIRLCFIIITRCSGGVILHIGITHKLQFRISCQDSSNLI